jgi:hypothetical protein
VKRLLIAAAALILTACAATQDSAAIAAQAPGFWLGLWHGFIFPIAWIVSLFADQSCGRCRSEAPGSEPWDLGQMAPSRRA